MKYINNLIYIICVGLASIQMNAQRIVTDKSEVNFNISAGAIFSVDGTFTGMQGDFNFDETDIQNSNFDICINSKSIDTDNAKRDKHLKSDDFFSVETYPSICFKSVSVSKTKTGFETSGNLTLHGITKLVTIPFTFKNNTFQGEFEINRFDYNIGEDYGTFRVGETATVSIICQVI